MPDDKRQERELKRQIKKAGQRKLRRYLKDFDAEPEDFDYGRKRSDVMNKPREPEKAKRADSPPPPLPEPVYQLEPTLSPDEFIDVLRRSTLAERRPVDRPEIIAGMLEHASVIVTARLDGRLVGVSRAITDFSYCTYLSDLAVDMAHQGRSIGRELVRRTHEAAGRHTTLILLAAPKAETYYPHIGMRRHESCWIEPGVL